MPNFSQDFLNRLRACSKFSPVRTLTRGMRYAIPLFTVKKLHKKAYITDNQLKNKVLKLMPIQSDTFFMKKALQMAYLAEKRGEVPVGAIVVFNQKIIAQSFNQKECLQDACAHAEIMAIQKASQKLKQWRLHSCKLYVTLEPCLMCAGAILQARLKQLIYGCKDPKAGAVDSLYQVLTNPQLNHQVKIKRGILSSESSQMLKAFFQKKRSQQKKI